MKRLLICSFSIFIVTSTGVHAEPVAGTTYTFDVPKHIKAEVKFGTFFDFKWAKKYVSFQVSEKLPEFDDDFQEIPNTTTLEDYAQPLVDEARTRILSQPVTIIDQETTEEVSLGRFKGRKYTFSINMAGTKSDIFLYVLADGNQFISGNLVGIDLNGKRVKEAEQLLSNAKRNQP